MKMGIRAVDKMENGGVSIPRFKPPDVKGEHSIDSQKNSCSIVDHHRIRKDAAEERFALKIVRSALRCAPNLAPRLFSFSVAYPLTSGEALEEALAEQALTEQRPPD
jgi:hypothetical protein